MSNALDIQTAKAEVIADVVALFEVMAAAEKTQMDLKHGEQEYYKHMYRAEAFADAVNMVAQLVR